MAIFPSGPRITFSLVFRKLCTESYQKSGSYARKITMVFQHPAKGASEMYVSVLQGKSRVNRSRRNPFLTPKMAVVCTGFTVRAASGGTVLCRRGIHGMGNHQCSIGLRVGNKRDGRGESPPVRGILHPAFSVVYFGGTGAGTMFRTGGRDHEIGEHRFQVLVARLLDALPGHRMRQHRGDHRVSFPSEGS